MSGVKVEQRPGLGNVLVAAQQFQPGEAVVNERPLLHVPQLKPSNPLYKPLQAYFEQHQVPPSVVLKVMAFVAASPATQASVLRCFCPDTEAYADAPVVRQARAFASILLQHPPVREFADWAATQQPTTAATTQATDAAAPTAGAAGSVSAGSETDTSMQQHPQAFEALIRVWLIWVMNGHSFKLGSALFDYGSKLTHTCACPNTMYRTAKGDIASVVESVDGSSGGSGSNSLQQQPAGSTPMIGGDATAAGAHIALTNIEPGDLLTTNYLGMGHKRMMSTPARQKYLQDKFLFRCTCHRCTQEVDLARGIPCPSCSGSYRAQDKLLQEQEALPDWHLGDSLSSNLPAGSAAADAAADSSASGDHGHTVAESSTPAAVQHSGTGPSSSSTGCGYIYCDMTELLVGAEKPWKCDVCGSQFANNTADLWGRYYTKSHATIESEMEGWVNRLDASMDSAPLVRDPSVLHQRMLGVLRLLGPRQWASWRLLLLGVEMQCGAIEEANIKAQMRQSRARRAAEDAAKAAADATPATDALAADSAAGAGAASKSGDAGPAPTGSDAAAALYNAAAADHITQLAVLIVRYCKQLWAAVGGKYGEVEAGQVLGYHFSEACQVLLSVASSPGMLPQQTANGLVDAALQLQMLVLPGVRSIMGPTYNPLAGLLGTDGLAAAGGVGGQPDSAVDAAAVAAAMRRQQQQRAAEANQMMSLVQQLKQLEAREGA